MPAPTAVMMAQPSMTPATSQRKRTPKTRRSRSSCLKLLEAPREDPPAVLSSGGRSCRRVVQKSTPGHSTTPMRMTLRSKEVPQWFLPMTTSRTICIKGPVEVASKRRDVMFATAVVRPDGGMDSATTTCDVVFQHCEQGAQMAMPRKISGTRWLHTATATTSRPMVHGSSTRFNKRVRGMRSEIMPMGKAKASCKHPRVDSTAPTSTLPRSPPMFSK
mmetsp:Transcript_52073/g.139445  ORF Transcript_52073/g.139445 Transcript_52073/m.139445 type:complete len:218 (+) Transcript_52073:135-788(+)